MIDAMRPAIFSPVALICCAALVVGCAKPPIPPATQPIAAPVVRMLNIHASELLVPFYEGILIDEPPVALHEVGLERLELAYPGPLSAPFVAWQTGDNNWTAIYSTQLGALPVQLEIAAEEGKLEITLSCPQTCSIDQLTIHGSWQQVVEAVRQHWKVDGPKVRLADRFKRIDFYVHQWISPKEGPPLRVDWTIDQLQAAMRKTPATNLVQIYGFDPAGIDLGGQYFWSDSALSHAKRVLKANPQISHLAWLNLRSFKYDIPRLRRQVPLTPRIRSMAKLFDGKIREDDEYAYKAIDMCLASERWQASRIRELDRLMDAGFKVIQLDEFPIASVWNVVPCQATDHLHKPGDASDEWTQSTAFIKLLSDRAQKRGVLLTCEEPSAALLPYISGYVDRQFNDSIDLYWMRHRSRRITTLPIFSTMFGDLTTPYTDVDGAEPARVPPKFWLRAHKMVRSN